MESEQARQACQDCGRLARLMVLEGYASGRPIVTRYCLACAPGAKPVRQPMVQAASHLLRLGSLLVFLGLLAGLLGAFADPFRTLGDIFVWYRRAGLAAGALAVFLGAVLRVKAVAMVGVTIFGLAAIAGLAVLAGNAGLGWKQEFLVLMGAILVAGGIYLRQRVCAACESSAARGAPARVPQPARADAGRAREGVPASVNS